MSANWETEIRAREEQARAAFLAADIATLERLWSDEYVVNSPLNRVHDKRRVLELLQAGRIRHSSFQIDIEQVSRFGTTVVVMGGDVVTDPPDGAVSRRRYTNVWQLEGGTWRSIARHANLVSREPPPARAPE